MTTSRVMLALPLLLVLVAVALAGEGGPPRDLIPVPGGDLAVTFVGHGTLVLEWNGKTVHIDPWGKLADYAGLPKADLVLVTHEHQDHLDAKAIDAVRTPSTVVVATAKAAAALPGALSMGNGESREIAGVRVSAVPAYNLINKRPDGTPFHPKGEGNGYLVTFGETTIYVAGDTEIIPEMKALAGKVTIAFLPMNLPYTMTPEMAADAARMIRPRILYPYHTGETDLAKLGALLAGEKGIDLRVRPMK